jgi:hypothetical protein
MAHGSRFLRMARMTVAVLFASGLGACTAVKPYERGRLAHPSMTGNRMAGPGASHMQAVHEGATGGAIGVEGGCGCN